MATVTGDQPLTTQELLQLIKSLRDAQAADDQANSASGIARDANANYREISNKTQTYADRYAALLDALGASINKTPEQDADFARNRADQIFSSYAGSVDRANTIAASQAGAKAYSRGMADSSQATDQVGNLTRNFSDVYTKLQEVARQRAFDELKARSAIDTQNYSAAAQGLNGTLRMALENAQKYSESAGRTASATNKERGETQNKVLDTGAAGNFMNGINTEVQKAGGYGQLLQSLKNGLFGNTGSTPDANPLAPANAGSTAANPKPGEFGFQNQDWSFYDTPTASASDAQAWNQVQPDDSWYTGSGYDSFAQDF